MEGLRYIDGAATLRVDKELCVGCGLCRTVCPHRVLTLIDKKAEVVDGDGCIECGGCARNCPVGAIHVAPGVGCAEAIINSWLRKVTGRRMAGGCC